MIDAFNFVVLLVIKWKKSHTARTVLKSNRKIAETETKWTPLIYVYLTYDSSFNLLGTDTSINKVAGLNTNTFIVFIYQR